VDEYHKPYNYELRCYSLHMVNVYFLHQLLARDSYQHFAKLLCQGTFYDLPHNRKILLWIQLYVQFFLIVYPRMLRCLCEDQ